MPLETVETILDRDSHQNRQKNPISGENAVTSILSAEEPPVFTEFRGILDQVEAETPNEAKIMHPREARRQAAAIAGLPPEIAENMGQYLKLMKEQNEHFFLGHHH